MSTYVIDASVAAKWLFLEEGSKNAEALLEEFSFFFIPDLFLIEVDAVITKKVRQREITSDEALVKMEKVRKLPYKFLRYKKIAKLSFELSISLPLTLYDATYIATAIETHGIVYTADRRLVNGLADTSLTGYVQSIWGQQ